MNNDEAKFILHAYRPNGSDAGDPLIEAALAQAESNFALRSWLERQRQLDAAVCAKLRETLPPPDLRESILAGSRVTAAPVRRRRWRVTSWLAAAAVITVASALTVHFWPALTRPAWSELAAFAVRDLTDAHHEHVGRPPNLQAFQTHLVSAPLPLTRNLKLDLDDLRSAKCRSVMFAGREVFELCFRRDGTWYHLYVARRSDFAPSRADPVTLLNVSGRVASTVWADADCVYALITRAGVEALRRVL